MAGRGQRVPLIRNPGFGYACSRCDKGFRARERGLRHVASCTATPAPQPAAAAAAQLDDDEEGWTGDGEDAGNKDADDEDVDGERYSTVRVFGSPTLSYWHHHVGSLPISALCLCDLRVAKIKHVFKNFEHVQRILSGGIVSHRQNFIPGRPKHVKGLRYHQ